MFFINPLWILTGIFALRFTLGLFIWDSRHLPPPTDILFQTTDLILSPITRIIHLISLLTVNQLIPTTPIQYLATYCANFNISCDNLEVIFAGKIEWVYLLATIIFLTLSLSLPPCLKQLSLFIQQVSTHNLSAPNKPAQKPQGIERINTSLSDKDAFSERMLKEALRSEILNDQQTLLRQYEENAKILEAKANTDKLTGLSNRRGMSQKAIVEWYQAQRNQKPFHIALFDLDNFKTINDTFGHHIGDEVLQFTAHVLKTHFPSPYITFRYGGEEFGVILFGLPPEQAFTKLDQCRQSISEYRNQQHPNCSVSTSIGLLSMPSKIMPSLYFDEEKIFSQVDQLLYQAKGQGKNQVVQNVLSI